MPKQAMEKDSVSVKRKKSDSEASDLPATAPQEKKNKPPSFSGTADPQADSPPVYPHPASNRMKTEELIVEEGG